ncbi:MAG TPA: cyclic beta 1-2 glucan synthetase, partial [Bacteroidia bacterium]|nr:cyclic beta 1-2 glucan synthetase [Bacteroidia bacterium]
VTVSLPDAKASKFARMHGNEPGIDPYTRASSDVYQDLFGEGSFIGKGIYEVDTFTKVLDGRFPKNRILSHDLIEGCYVRSGLLSDVQLFEKYPTSYRADRQRIARWTRGDWQIFPWFMPMVPGAGKHWHKNPISALSRWKIFDNIRRSLVPLGLTVLILLGWLVLPSYIYWTISVSAIIVIPIIITTIWDTLRKPKDIILKHHVKNAVNNIADISTKTLFSLICLPYEAFSNLMAILRTLWRMLITRKKLLEWNPSSNDNIFNETGLTSSYFTMWVEPLLSVTVFIYLAAYSKVNLNVAGPILTLWLIAPLITWWTSRPRAKAVSKLSHEQNIFLRKIARKTFGFFEQFVQQEDNWLPPDNFQEQPMELLAHRTSPTNIGLALLSNLSALEFGYITSRELTERTTNTISTLHKMERFKGHFYNWYDTQTLNPLTPRYVSTVDSGNLIGNLLVLQQGLLAIPHKKILGHRIFEGIRDTLNVLLDTLDEKETKLLRQFKSDLDEACNSHVVTRYEVKYFMGILTETYTSLFEKLNNESQSEAYWWKQKLKIQIEKINEEFKIFAPWFLLMSAPPKFINLLSRDANSTWLELFKSAKELLVDIEQFKKAENTAIEEAWMESFEVALNQSIMQVEKGIALVRNLADECNELADMEFDFLFDKNSNLFTIGYNVQEHHMDPSFYDLLASEARLCAYIGI